MQTTLRKTQRASLFASERTNGFSFADTHHRLAVRRKITDESVHSAKERCCSQILVFYLLNYILLL